MPQAAWHMACRTPPNSAHLSASPESRYSVPRSTARPTAACNSAPVLSTAKPTTSRQTTLCPPRSGGTAPDAASLLVLTDRHIPTHIQNLFTQQEPESPCYRVTVYDYGKGIVEGTVLKQHEKPHRRKGPQERERKTRDLMDPDQLEKSYRRAKKTARQKAIMMKADRILTLTYKENVTDMEIADNHFAKFIRRMKQHDPSFRYVAVYEYQKRGAIHFHLALNKFYAANVVRSFWTHGNIDFSKVRQAKTPKEAARIARYLTKYMGKDFGNQQANKKRYYATKGIPEPKKLVVFIPFGPSTYRHVSDLIEAYFGSIVETMQDIPSTARQMTYFATF